MVITLFQNYVEDGSWDFRGEDTKEYTHCFHIYPAMMIPQIARKLITLYGANGTFLFDPYCGTGTSLVEGRLAGMNVAGTDLNPTARLISESKLEDYDENALASAIHHFSDELQTELSKLSEDYRVFAEPSCVSFERLETWFPPLSISEVSFCLDKIRSLEVKQEYKKFLLVCLSECLRLISYQRNNEFKLYRISPEERPSHYVPLFGILKNRLDRNQEGVRNFLSRVKKETTAEVYSFNTVVESGEQLLSQPNPSIVVTSPPYGDSPTTVAYAQFSWLTNVWFDLDPRTPGALDKVLMGGRKSELKPLGFGPLDSAISSIGDEDQKRATEVMNFFEEYYISIQNVASILEEGGYACYVVGNRSVKGVTLPTDQFTAWAFEKAGLEYVCTHTREIPNKRMPSTNSPSNVAGETGKTMDKEYIVVCKKN